MHRISLLAITLTALTLVGAGPADAARQTQKKAMWGPTTLNGKSAFPIYRDLGVGIWQTNINWAEVAPTEPVSAANPADPAYRWPSWLSGAVRQARRNKIKVLVQVYGAPAWANGGRNYRWAPRKVADYKRFMTAASRRYKRVKYWMIWGEPSRRGNFRPLRHETRGKRLNRKQRKGPRKYAQLVEAGYKGVKAVQRKDKVVAGNSFTTGDVSAKNWVRYVKLPNGKPPRMDFWGHNPFGYRKPRLSDPPLGNGFADFGTLDTFVRWLDRWQRRGGRKKIFISEYTLPTDHENYEFNFYATHKAQAQFVKAALRITRRWKRIATFGWHSLLDEAPRGPDGTHADEVHRGLMTYDGQKKRSYRAFKRN